jgi:phosphoglycerol transferase MdoB-like AlkP superfamily enzyme
MRNPTFVYLKSYLILFVIILILNILCRQLLFFFNSGLFQIQFSQFAAYTFWGIRFDLSAIAYGNMLFIVLALLPLPIHRIKFYRTILFWSGLIPNILILAPNIADAFYFPFVFRRSTYDLLFILFTMKGEMNTLWKDLIFDFWPAYLIFAFCIFILVFSFRKFNKSLVPSYKGMKDYLAGIAIFLIICSLTVIAIRGGLQKKPISLVTAGMYAPPNHTPLVLNSTFSIIRTWGKTGLDRKDYFDDTIQMFSHFNPCKQYHDTSFTKKNVVFIILESFSCEHLNSINKGNLIDSTKNFAPFLDSLIHQGLFCPHAFANGKRSVEGIPAIISSVPTLMNTPYILSPYINNNLPGLPGILETQDYYSVFFHGGQNGTMNFDAYAKTVGFHEYSGKNEYPENADFDGKWGIRDEPYLQFVVSQINTFQQPFFATVFTLSSHHPYLIPEKYETILPEGPLPIHKAIAYTDLALKRFFLSASKQNWYYNTLFVITSDHSSEPWLNEYKEPAGLYSVPLLFYDPGAQLHGIYEKTCQQTDIMPSVLDYLGYSDPFSAFGNSIFDTLQPGFAVAYTGNGYQIISDEYILLFSEDQPIKLWNYRSDPSGAMNLLDATKNFNQISEKLTLVLKAYIQCYNNSLIDNSILCP